MCRRYTITADLAELQKLVRFIFKITDYKPRYNLAPGQQAPVLVWEGDTATLKPMRWGLIPSWANDESIGGRLINAPAETISQQTCFRHSFERQRCLIPADGFYEWQNDLDGTQPYRFTRKDGGVFCMAGLWESWRRPHHHGDLGLDDTGPNLTQVIETFTIITTEPNPLVAAVHSRMPAILDPEHYRWWLEPYRFEPQFLKALLRPYPAAQMGCVRVSKIVNDVKNDRVECLVPG